VTPLRSRIYQAPGTPPSVQVIGKDYGNIKEVPTMRIQINPGVILYEDLQPLIAADGAPIAATGNGTWGQLYAVGRR
jgi:hypothetical protein